MHRLSIALVAVLLVNQSLPAQQARTVVTSDNPVIQKGLKFQGTWNAVTVYNLFDVVTLGNNSYVCLQGNSGVNPSSSAVNWLAIAGTGPAGSNVPLTDANLAANTSAILQSISATQRIQALTSNLNGVLNVKAAPYNAYGDATHDDTVAINQVLSDAYTKKLAVYFPASTYRITGTIHLHGVHAFGAGEDRSVIQLDSGLTMNAADYGANGFYEHFTINGGWDGKTNNLAGSCMASLSPFTELSYANTWSNVKLTYCNYEALAIQNGAYNNLDNVFFSAVGGRAIVDSMSTQGLPGYPATSLEVKNGIFNTAFNGRAFRFEQGSVSMHITGAKIEDTLGVELIGSGHRNFAAYYNYFENFLGSIKNNPAFVFTNTDGVGLSIHGNRYGVMAEPQPSDVAGWLNYSSDESWSGSASIGDDGKMTTVRGYSNTADPYVRTYLRGTSISTTFTALVPVIVYANGGWQAIFNISSLDYTSVPSVEPILILSHDHPTGAVGNSKLTCSVNSSGYFGCQVDTNSVRLTGQLTFIPDNQHINSSHAIQAADLSGTGNAPVCVNANGQMYRGTTGQPCQ